MPACGRRAALGFSAAPKERPAPFFFCVLDCPRLTGTWPYSLSKSGFTHWPGRRVLSALGRAGFLAGPVGRLLQRAVPWCWGRGEHLGARDLRQLAPVPAEPPGSPGGCFRSCRTAGTKLRARLPALGRPLLPVAPSLPPRCAGRPRLVVSPAGKRDCLLLSSFLSFLLGISAAVEGTVCMAPGCQERGKRRRPGPCRCALGRRRLPLHGREERPVCVFPGAEGSQSLDRRLAVPADISEDHPVCVGEGAAARRHHHLRGWSL